MRILRGGEVAAGPFHLWVGNEIVFVGAWEMGLDEMAEAIRRLHDVAQLVTSVYGVG